jgi:dTMP kinase
MGWLVAIEGIDGSGKGTQARELVSNLMGLGLRAATISFPQYESTMAGSLIGEYLNGDFGPGMLPPKLSALLYAVDRFESLRVLHGMMDENDVVVLDRYVGSNLAHQGIRHSRQTDLETFMLWVTMLEHDVFGMPAAATTILIDMPVAASAQLVARKNTRGYTDKKADLHEADGSYMAKVRSQYVYLAERLGWSIVSGRTTEDLLKTVEQVGAEILRIVLKSMGQLYRLDPQVEFDRHEVARRIHETWCQKPWDESSVGDREDSKKSADVAIAEVVRQLGLKVG